MTKIEIINDLWNLKVNLIREFGYAPSALDYAISELLEDRPEMEVRELKKEDFYDELPLWTKEEEPHV